MNRLGDHLLIAPIVLPLFAGAIMLALGGERRRTVNAAINVMTTFALVGRGLARHRIPDPESRRVRKEPAYFPRNVSAVPAASKFSVRLPARPRTLYWPLI